ncbi:MAG: biopolymer transporter ExbD, partial [Gammaproteobacteria bacterium]|nr:biopolymer transporter ExbD [Gammaproteobacteria bacterium]
DLNMVPMIDMMIILVFFLIFTAVFSKTNILELNLPSSTAGVPDLPDGLQLEVIVREASIDVADRRTGVLQSLPNTPGGYDLSGLGSYLERVKAKFPANESATILMGPDISYDVLVQVMDTVRVRAMPGAPGVPAPMPAELFPQISVGDAPT